MPRDLFSEQPQQQPRDLFAGAAPSRVEGGVPPLLAPQPPAMGASGLSAGAAPSLQEPADSAQGGDSYLAQGLSGLAEGAASGVGSLMQGAAMFGNLQRGILPDEAHKRGLSAKALGLDAEGLKSKVQGILPARSADPGKRFARRVSQGVGEVAPFAMTGGAPAAIRTLVYGAGSGAGGAIANEIAPNDPTADLIGSFIGGLSPAAADTLVSKMSRAATARKAVPTSEQLKSMAGDLYDEAERAGVTASGAKTTSLSDSMRQLAANEGLITPKGRIDASMPKIRSVIKMMDDYAGGSMTPTQMQAVRRTLQNAAGSADNAERRVGRIMLNQFDNFTEKLAPQFKEARGFYKQAMKAETLETARELAGARAGQFSGSGFENALRTEYRKLDREIINGRQRGFTAEEIQAIKKVARGTPASNAARMVGRLAPKGPVSVIPTLAGGAYGGPVGAAGVAALGYGGRALATRLGVKAADTAELLVRAGQSPAKVAAMTAAQREALAQTLAAQTAARGADSSDSSRP